MAILAIPSICDLLCTLLLLVAQIYITASMWQMLRGSVIVFTALMKRFLLQHRLRMHMWWGVFIICVAMVLVAATSFLEPSSEKGGSAKDPRIGVVLVIFCCLAQGLQYVFEEKVHT
jgi:drug/metabolite transporter (DMT)-like permease